MGDGNISKNVTSDFKGSALIPLDREQVLQRLPQRTQASESQAANQDNSMIWVATFQEYLEGSRKQETVGLRKAKKKLNVPAGKGICEENVPENVPELSCQILVPSQNRRERRGN